MTRPTTQTTGESRRSPRRGARTPGRGRPGARADARHAIYVIGAVIGFVLALVSIAVVTRFLAPAQFGQLALLLIFAAFLTIFYNVGTLQGTFLWVFGSAGEEDVEDDSGESSQAGTKRKALGTGLIITVAIITVVGTRSSWRPRPGSPNRCSATPATPT